MRIIPKVAAIAVGLFALAPAVTAGAAQNACTEGAYVCPIDEIDETGGSDAGGGGAEVDDRPAPASSGGPAKVESGGPANVESGNPVGGPVNAPTGGLPITGGDVLGMATVGAVAIALGGVLVRRSKVAKHRSA